MAALTKNRKTSERIAELRQLEAGGKICTGGMVAVNADGKAVPASDTSGLTVIGVALTSAAAGGMVTVKSSCFKFAFDGTLTGAVIGKEVFVKDDQTVALTSTNSIPAGTVFDVDGKGVWVIVGK